MTIKTKYNVGQRVWIVYENRGEVSVHDDHISDIIISDGDLIYGTREGYSELKEEEVILYEETDKLADKVIKTMEEIRKSE